MKELKSKKSIESSLEDLTELIRAGLPAYRDRVAFIVSNRAISGREIEKLLDDLMNATTLNKEAERLFYTLVKHYSSVDPKGAQFYLRFYEELHQGKKSE